MKTTTNPFEQMTELMLQLKAQLAEQMALTRRIKEEIGLLEQRAPADAKARDTLIRLGSLMKEEIGPKQQKLTARAQAMKSALSGTESPTTANGKSKPRRTFM